MEQMTRGEIEHKMDELARKDVETQNPDIPTRTLPIGQRA